MENLEYNWIFPGNNYTNENGLDTADMETFKKDPMASLAREICQNSIDAKAEGEKKAKVVFHSFEVNRNKIPQIERLEKEIDSCLNYWKEKNSSTTVEQLKKMSNYIKLEKIHCLRISDYNTTGLSGVHDTENGSFYLLTKGSGISDKNGTKGGSKGIGKFATFVTSNINTVFYSTLNQKNEEGYIGISKLCSTRIEGTDEKTIGTGYYGKDTKNSAIDGQISLDDNYKRNTTGTDIYIIGFKEHNDWKKEIITKILESFMVAIMYDELEVEVDDLVLNRETLKKIINEYRMQNDNIAKNIVSQYLLLTEDASIVSGKIPVLDYGNVTVKVKVFNSKEREFATNECVMVRSPYMKIKSLKHITSIPFSALCIIDDNIINEMLRKIENPEHTDWQIKRIEDKDEQDELRNIKNSLEQNVRNFIQKNVVSSDNSISDLEGASDYLPLEADDIGEGSEETKIIAEKPKLIKRFKNKVSSKVGNFVDNDSNNYQPDIGNFVDNNEDETIKPEGHNNGKGGNAYERNTKTGHEDGDNEILALKQLTGIKYRFICPSKKDGKVIIAFDSPYEEKNCSLELNYVDSLGTAYYPYILSAKINNENIDVIDGKINGFKLNYGKTKIELDTNVRELYAWEVRIYANKE